MLCRLAGCVVKQPLSSLVLIVTHYGIIASKVLHDVLSHHSPPH